VRAEGWPGEQHAPPPCKVWPLPSHACSRMRTRKQEQRAPAVDAVGGDREARHDADVERQVRKGARRVALKAVRGDGLADVAQAEWGRRGEVEGAVLCLNWRRCGELRWWCAKAVGWGGALLWMTGAPPTEG